MSEYPQGAIKSIEEFQALFRDSNGTVWEASREFKSVTEIAVTGNIITKRYTDGQEYIGYEYNNGYNNYNSAVDMHLIDQDYNDWYLFTNREDAEAHAQRSV